MRDRSKRKGVTAVMRVAEQRIYALAPLKLSPLRYRELQAVSGRSLFVSGNYPMADWESLAGFVPDHDFHYEVTVGIATPEGEKNNLLARALISRDADEDYCHIVWEPDE